MSIHTISRASPSSAAVESGGFAIASRIARIASSFAQAWTPDGPAAKHLIVDPGTTFIQSRNP
jgi:hypothetical protein